MKYISYIIWLILSAIMLLLIFPAIFASACDWFDLGDKILEHESK